MGTEENPSEGVNRALAGVCGLYCGACTLFIATTEDPERLTRLAARLHASEEAIQCHGCRSDKRASYCTTCKMSACAAQRGIDFCSECQKYPCDDLKQFQAAMPHRLELWADLERIQTVGCQQWLTEVRERYACLRCNTINSAYDLKCRTCDEEPSNNYTAKHKQTIEQFFGKQ